MSKSYWDNVKILDKKKLAEVACFVESDSYSLVWVEYSKKNLWAEREEIDSFKRFIESIVRLNKLDFLKYFCEEHPQKELAKKYFVNQINTEDVLKLLKNRQILIVDYLIKCGLNISEILYWYGYYGGEAEIASLLIALGADVNYEHNNCSLFEYLAIGEWHSYKKEINNKLLWICIENGGELPLKSIDLALINACFFDDKKLFSFWISKGAKVNSSQEVAENCLIEVTANRSFSLIEILLNEGLDIKKNTASNEVCQKCISNALSDIQFLDILINNGLDINNGIGYWLKEALVKNKDRLDFLISKGFNLNLVPFDFISYSNDRSKGIIEYLHTKGMSLQNIIEGQSLLDKVAIEYNRFDDGENKYEAIEYLIKNNAIVVISTHALIEIGFKKNNKCILKFAIDKLKEQIFKCEYINLDEVLTSACKYKDLELVRLAMSVGANPNYNNVSSIYYAVENDFIEAVSFLILVGARPQDCIEIKHIDIYLLDCALKCEGSDMINLLLKSDCTLNQLSLKAFNGIIRARKFDILYQLFNYEIPPEYLENGLIESINLQNIDLVNIFIKKGATIDKSVLIKAIDVNNFELFTYFFKIGGIDTDNHALYYSIKNKKYEFVKFLIDKLDDVNIEYKPEFHDKKSILFFAIESGSHEIASYLLNRGANPMIPERHVKSWKWDSTGGYEVIENVPCLSDLVNKMIDIEMLKLMLKKGLSIKYFYFKNFFEKYDYSFDVLMLFIEYGYDISDFFDEYDFGFNIYDSSGDLTTQNELFIPNAPIESLKYILENTKFLGKHDIKILYYAARANRLDLIKILVEMGANVKGMRGKSLAEIFHDGAPEYKWWTIDLSDGESISELYYIRSELNERKWWYFPRNFKGSQKISEDINKKVEKLAAELLKSSDNITINYLLKYGAPRNWKQHFPEVVKDMLLLKNSVSEAKDRDRMVSNEEMARDGWSAAFENFSDENYPDYI